MLPLPRAGGCFGPRVLLTGYCPLRSAWPGSTPSLGTDRRFRSREWVPAARGGAAAAPGVSSGVPFGSDCLAQGGLGARPEPELQAWARRPPLPVSGLLGPGLPTSPSPGPGPAGVWRPKPRGVGQFPTLGGFPLLSCHLSWTPGSGWGLRMGGDEWRVARAREGMGFEKMSVSYM